MSVPSAISVFVYQSFSAYLDRFSWKFLRQVLASEQRIVVEVVVLTLAIKLDDFIHEMKENRTWK